MRPKARVGESETTGLWLGKKRKNVCHGGGEKQEAEKEASKEKKIKKVPGKKEARENTKKRMLKGRMTYYHRNKRLVYEKKKSKERKESM